MRALDPYRLACAAVAVALATDYDAEEILHAVSDRPGHDYVLRGIRAIDDETLRATIRPRAVDAEWTEWTAVARAVGYLVSQDHR